MARALDPGGRPGAAVSLRHLLSPSAPVPQRRGRHILISPPAVGRGRFRCPRGGPPALQKDQGPRRGPQSSHKQVHPGRRETGRAEASRDASKAGARGTHTVTSQTDPGVRGACGPGCRGILLSEPQPVGEPSHTPSARPRELMLVPAARPQGHGPDTCARRTACPTEPLQAPGPASSLCHPLSHLLPSNTRPDGRQREITSFTILGGPGAPLPAFLHFSARRGQFQTHKNGQPCPPQDTTLLVFCLTLIIYRQISRLVKRPDKRGPGGQEDRRPASEAHEGWGQNGKTST